MQYKFFDGTKERAIEADMFEVEALTVNMVHVSFYGSPYAKVYKHPITGEDVVLDRREKLSSFHVVDGWHVEGQEVDAVEQASKILRGMA